MNHVLTGPRGNLVVQSAFGSHILFIGWGGSGDGGGEDVWVCAHRPDIIDMCMRKTVPFQGREEGSMVKCLERLLSSPGTP